MTDNVRAAEAECREVLAKHLRNNSRTGDGKPEGTPEALARCAAMLDTYAPDLFPANEKGQVNFARAMMESVADEIRAYLSAPPRPPGLDLERIIDRIDGLAMRIRTERPNPFEDRPRSWQLADQITYNLGELRAALARRGRDTGEVRRPLTPTCPHCSGPMSYARIVELTAERDQLRERVRLLEAAARVAVADAKKHDPICMSTHDAIMTLAALAPAPEVT